MMDKFLNDAFSIIRKIMTSKWSIVIVLGMCVLVFFISYIAQYIQLKNATKQFNTGTYNTKTLGVFEKFKRRSIFPQSAELHDLCCCILSAMYMQQDDATLYFENINSIKNMTDNISWRVYLLLAAYLTGKRYHDIVVVYREKEECQNTEEIIVQILHACDRDTIFDRAMTAKEKVTNQKISEILHTLTETGDDSPS